VSGGDVRPRRAPTWLALAVLGLQLALAAGGVGAAPQVVGPDDAVLDGAKVSGDGDAFWVGDGPHLPLRLGTDGDGALHRPALAVARLLVLDAASGRPVTAGRLRWLVAGAPEELAVVDWSAAGGRLDLGCRGGERVEISADGFRATTTVLSDDGRRQALPLEPSGALELQLTPPAAGRLWLAAETEVTALSPFFDAAREHEIGADGLLRLADLDRDAVHVGVVVVPGRAPVVGRVTDLPQRLELRLTPGLAVTGRVFDGRSEPLAGARVRAEGRIEELGGFRYRQEARSDAEGRFTVAGLLSGEVVVKACADGFACAEARATVAAGEAAEALSLRLEPGHDLRLVVRDEWERPAAGASVIDARAFRRHETDDDGVVRFEGLHPGATLELRIFGAGLVPWQGTVTADGPEVVLRLPLGAVLEWPVLTEREIAATDVVAGWTRLDARGREVVDGDAEWRPELRLVRAEGLAAGPHRLRLRLPGAATLTSGVVEVAAGETRQLPPAAPERGLAVAGRAVDAATLQPVAGARVTCEPGSPHQFRKPHELDGLSSAVTDADGLFLLEGLDPGRCRALVRAPGFATWRRDGVEPDEIGADIGDVELDHGMTIVGQVVDRAGRPLGGIGVEVFEDAAYAYVAETTARTDHSGWFRADGLSAGRWLLRAHRGDESARAAVEGRAGDTVSAELRLGGVALEGEVWIGDRPAAGGSLVLAGAGARGDGIVVMVQTDADERRFFGIEAPPVAIAVADDGRFAAAGISPGAYTASYTPPGAGGSPVSRELVVPQVETHRCLIRFADAAVEGVVVDGDGRPVAGAVVTVGAADGSTAASGFADGDGAFVFVGLDPGVVRLGAAHGEYGDAAEIEVELRSGDRSGPVTLELGQPDGAELILTVRSAGGSLAGAPVYLVGADTTTGFTDSAGVATFTGIAAGRHRACAAAYGGAVGCGNEIELDDGERRRAELELGSGGQVAVLLGPQERVPPLRLSTADGIDLSGLLMMVSPPTAGEEGLRIGPLRADRYRITVSTASGPREGEVAVREGDTVTLDLR